MLHCFIKHNFTKFTEEEYNQRLEEFTESDKILKDIMSLYDKEKLIEYIILLNKKSLMFKETIIELNNDGDDRCGYLEISDSLLEFKKMTSACLDELIKNHGAELRQYFEVNNIKDYADITDFDIVAIATKVGILNIDNNGKEK